MSHPSDFGNDTTRSPDSIPTRHSEEALTQRPTDRPTQEWRSDGALHAVADSTPDGVDRNGASPVVTTARTVSTRGSVTDPAAAAARQQERFGGIKVGSAFFGWLTATGMSV